MLKLVKRGNITTLLLQYNYPTCTCEDLQVLQYDLTIFTHSLSYSGLKVRDSVPNQRKRQYPPHVHLRDILGTTC